MARAKRTTTSFFALDFLRPFLEKGLAPLCKFLIKCHVPPNLITFTGFLVAFMVPISMIHDQWFAAGAWVLFSGFFDILDGLVARQMGKQGRFGAFFDSTLDRLCEAVVFAGFLLYYEQQHDIWNLLLAFSVCILSFMVSYARARAEGLGISCEVGVLPRPGRVLLLAAGFFTAQPTFFLALVGILSLITLLQRIHRVWSAARK
jgi:phosphatidylglycerophosphate synthase